MCTKRKFETIITPPPPSMGNKSSHRLVEDEKDLLMTIEQIPSTHHWQEMTTFTQESDNSFGNQNQSKLPSPNSRNATHDEDSSSEDSLSDEDSCDDVQTLTKPLAIDPSLESLNPPTSNRPPSPYQRTTTTQSDGKEDKRYINYPKTPATPYYLGNLRYAVGSYLSEHGYEIPNIGYMSEPFPVYRPVSVVPPKNVSNIVKIALQEDCGAQTASRHCSKFSPHSAYESNDSRMPNIVERAETILSKIRQHKHNANKVMSQSVCTYLDELDHTLYGRYKIVIDSFTRKCIRLMIAFPLTSKNTWEIDFITPTKESSDCDLWGLIQLMKHNESVKYFGRMVIGEYANSELVSSITSNTVSNRFRIGPIKSFDLRKKYTEFAAVSIPFQCEEHFNTIMYLWSGPRSEIMFLYGYWVLNKKPKLNQITYKEVDRFLYELLETETIEFFKFEELDPATERHKRCVNTKLVNDVVTRETVKDIYIAICLKMLGRCYHAIGALKWGDLPRWLLTYRGLCGLDKCYCPSMKCKICSACFKGETCPTQCVQLT